MPKEFLFFEKGKYPQGDYSSFDVLNEFVDRFNNSKLRMSFFVGHKYPWDIKNDDDELAHGEGVELRINQKGQIFMVDYECDDYLKEKIAKRQLLWCSPEIIGDPTKLIDITGLAFLGRTPPQNMKAIVPALFGKEDEAKIKSNFIGHFKIEKDFAKSFLIENNNKEDENPMTDEEKKMFEKMQNDLKDANQKIEALSNTQAAFKKENETEDAKVFFGKLQNKEGKLPPAFFEKAVAIDAKLDEASRKEYRQMFSEMKPVLDITGEHFAKTSPKGVDNQGVDIVTQITLFQAENKIENFKKATEMYYAKNPKAFGEEKE